MKTLRCISIAFLYHVVSAHLGRDHSASRWHQRTATYRKNPFDSLSHEKLSLGPVNARPKPGETGFGNDFLFPTVTPTPTFYSNFDYNVDYPNVVPTPSARRHIIRKIKMNRGLKNHNLDFIDPVKGGTFDVTYNPLPTEIYPTPTAFFSLQKLGTYPSTYETGKKKPTFVNPRDNSYAHDDAFFGKLASKRQKMLASQLARSARKSSTFEAKDTFWNPLFLYLMTQ